MLKGITWGEFLTVLAVALLLYYAVVGYLFFRKDLIGLLTGRSKEKEPGADAEVEPLEDDEWDSMAMEHERATADLDELEGKVAQLRVVLGKAGKGADKQALLKDIAGAMANYEGLHRPAFRHALNNFIVQYAEEFCELEIEEDELEELWGQE